MQSYMDLTLGPTYGLVCHQWNHRLDRKEIRRVEEKLGLLNNAFIYEG